jgi:hypothetical protein
MRTVKQRRKRGKRANSKIIEGKLQEKGHL